MTLSHSTTLKAISVVTGLWALNAAFEAPAQPRDLFDLAGAFSFSHAEAANCLSGDNHPYPCPVLTVSVSPSTPSFSGSGQTVTFTATVANPGAPSQPPTGPVGLLSVQDNLSNVYTCLATSLAIGGSTTCTYSYTTTSGDVTNGRAAYTVNTISASGQTTAPGQAESDGFGLIPGSAATGSGAAPNVTYAPPPAPVPTLGEWAVSLAGAALAFMGIYLSRRRPSHFKPD